MGDRQEFNMGERTWKDEVKIDNMVQATHWARFLATLIPIIPGCIMIGVGHSYLWTQDEDCPNGTVTYLYYAGILILVMHLFAASCYCANKCIECLETLSAGDWTMQGLMIRIFISDAILLTDIIAIIWGSVVVFGAYAGWKQSVDKNDPNFCNYTPFVTAFTILIISWLILPFLFICNNLALYFTICGTPEDKDEEAAEQNKLEETAAAAE